MNEKKKHSEKKTTGGNGDGFSGLGGLPNPMVSVSSGPYAEDLPIAGMSVGEVRQKYADRFDIGDGAQAVLNGKETKDDVILKTGENLMFIMHAGEKGAKVTLDGEHAKVASEGGESTMPIATLAERMGPPMSTGSVILPSGIKAVLSQGSTTVWVYEKPPHIARLSWVRADSPSPCGPGTTYRQVEIALPYLIVLAVFRRDGNGLPALTLKDECFFRNQPLKSLDDELCYPALLNCSKYNPTPYPGAPMSWICTQHLKHTKQMRSGIPGDRFQAGFEAVRYCLLETSFNLSSEHHEGNSWFGASKEEIPEIATVEKWEASTKKNPLFVLDAPWLKTGMSLKAVVDRIFQNHGQATGGVKHADDVARLIEMEA